MCQHIGRCMLSPGGVIRGVILMTNVLCRGCPERGLCCQVGSLEAPQGVPGERSNPRKLGLHAGERKLSQEGHGKKECVVCQCNIDTVYTHKL